MTQDKIRAAFEAWCDKEGQPIEMKQNALGYQNEHTSILWDGFYYGYQACAAEMGKDMEKMREALDYSKGMHSRAAALYLISSCGNAAYNEDNNHAIKLAAEALAPADKWRG